MTSKPASAEAASPAPRGRPRIVHVSADYPDPVALEKTQAIRMLLHLVEDRFDNQVISLNRLAPGWSAYFRPRLVTADMAFAEGLALAYHAPAKGIWHKTLLDQLGDDLARRITAQGVPDMLVGHKLTVEGLAVARAASRLGIPYALTLQGDTDTKILAARPDLIPAMRRVFHGAALVVAFAPWTLGRIEERLGKRPGPSRIIPCPTELDQPLAPDPEGRGLLSVFHLRSHRRKNLAGMAKALRHAASTGRPLALAIVGGGSAADIAAARRAAGNAPGLAFEGALGRSAVAARMNRAAAFVLPSKRESFGLVFIEALFAGCPVIYPRGQAIDGHFNGLPFAVAVDSDDARQISRAMADLEARQASVKQALAEWQTSSHAHRFTRAGIAKAYAEALGGLFGYADAPARLEIPCG